MSVIRTRLETERLRMRLFTPDDVQLTYDLGTDPDVIRYADDPIKDMDEARQLVCDSA